MFRLIIGGVHEEDAKLIADWLLAAGTKSGEMQSLFDIHGRTMTIKVIPVAANAVTQNTADGVVLVCKNDLDFKPLEEVYKAYADMPIKYLLYTEPKAYPEYESKWGAKGVAKGDPIALADMLITANNDLVKVLADVFKSFDSDKSGFIDLKEIGAAAKELGVEMNEKEVQKMMKALDTNKDGKISLEEFIEWWKTGRKGKKAKIGSVIEKLIGKNPIFQKFMESFPAGSVPASGSELMHGSFGVHVNKVKEPGIMIDFHIMTKGKSLEQEVAEYNKAVPLKPGLPFVGITFGVKNPENAHEMLQNVAGAAIGMAQGMIPNSEMVFSNVEFKYGKSAGKTALVVVPSEGGQMMVEQFMPMLSQFTSIISPNQFMDLSLAFATDFSKLINEPKAFYELLIEGIALEVKSQIDPKFNEAITEMSKNFIHMAGLPHSLTNNMAYSAAMNKFAKSGHGELDFEIDENLKELIKTQVAATPAAVPLSGFKAMLAPQAKEMISMVPILEMVHTFFLNEVNSIEFFVCMPDVVATKLKFNLPGLNDLISL